MQFWFIKRLIVAFVAHLSQSVSKVGPTRLYLNIRVTAPDLKWIERIYKCVWPWRSSSRLTGCCLAPTERRRCRQTGGGKQRRGGRSWATPGCTAPRTHLAVWILIQQSWGALISRHERVSALSTPLPLDWMLTVAVESASELSRRSFISSSGGEKQKKNSEK